MSESVERTSFDLRYEGYRMRDKAGEARLLASIVERGPIAAPAGTAADHSACILGEDESRTGAMRTGGHRSSPVRSQFR